MSTGQPSTGLCRPYLTIERPNTPTRGTMRSRASTTVPAKRQCQCRQQRQSKAHHEPIAPKLPTHGLNPPSQPSDVKRCHHINVPRDNVTARHCRDQTLCRINPLRNGQDRHPIHSEISESFERYGGVN